MTERRRALILLGAAVALSLWLNFRGLGWGLVTAPNGQVFLLHPDEGANLAAVRHSLGNKAVWLWQEPQMRPYYLKGQFYYTQLRLMAILAAPFIPVASRGFDLLARSWTAVQGTLCVILTAALGWRVLGPVAGPLPGAVAALLVAVCPGLTAHSHYMTQDVPLTLLALVVLLLCVEVESEGGTAGPGAAFPQVLRPDSPRTRGSPRGVTRLASGLGAALGLAVAAKHSGWTLLVPAVWVARRLDWRSRFVLAASGALSVALFDPILWAEPGLVRRGMAMLAENNRHGVEFCAARFPGWIDYAVSVLPYSTGTFLAVLAAVGLVSLAAFRRAWPLLIWLAAYWLMMGFDRFRLVRYTVPLLPVLCVAAAAVPLYFRKEAGGWALCAAAFIGALFCSAAYTGAMRLPDPRFQAFLWFMKEVPAPARIAVPQVHYASVPEPPGGELKQVGFDWKALEDSGEPYFAFSDIDWLRFKEAAAYYPREADFIARMEGGSEFTKVIEFENSMTFLGWTMKKGWAPHDWLYPDAKISVYKRSS